MLRRERQYKMKSGEIGEINELIKWPSLKGRGEKIMSR
jgi:hypothetical protein